ncbi:MAG TPA: plasmid replication initiator TrfA [Pirellulales bacterium]|jgi:hypothetical protein|nr:plasmid replication initiator TrfA [Pirellulales bacterium]
MKSNSSVNRHPKEFEAAIDNGNLAEFPVSLLSDKAPSGVKTIEFEDTIEDWRTGQIIHRKVTVSGSDKFGLPTAIDDEVLFGLIQRTAQHNNFTQSKVSFTRHQLIQILGWKNRSWAYERLEESLCRWKGVSIYYTSGWWDNAKKVFTDREALGVIDYFRVRDGRRKATGDDSDESYFMWNEAFFQSFQSGYLNRLDFGVYRSLKRPAAKRAYRFLTKRFYHRPVWTFDLKTFAFEKIGLSRNYDTGQLKARLKPALDELQTVGVIHSPRYSKQAPGAWSIEIAEKTAVANGAVQPEQSNPLVDELVQRGVHSQTAHNLVASCPETQIREKLAWFDWLVRRADQRISRNAPGFLVNAIRKNYVVAKRFVERASGNQRIANVGASSRPSPG